MRHIDPLSRKNIFGKKQKKHLNPGRAHRQSILALQRKNAELTKANEDLTAFTYVSSHDLQEPLRKIRVFASAILKREEQNLSERGKEYFRRLQETSKHMQDLLDDLISYSQTRELDRVYETINLSEVLNAVRTELADEIRDTGASIIATELCDAHIITFQFRILFRNLLANALKFRVAGRAPVITLTTEIMPGSKYHIDTLNHDMRYCHITVTDNGIGFDSKYRDRIFRVFTRLHTTDEYAGTGIGLAICKRIVENHNGYITASGKINEGARFDIYIPSP